VSACANQFFIFFFGVFVNKSYLNSSKNFHDLIVLLIGLIGGDWKFLI